MSVSEAKFEKAVQIIQGLPKDGPVKPTQDDQLFVSGGRHRLTPAPSVVLTTVP